MRRIDRSPARFSSAVAGGMAIVAVGATGRYSLFAVALGAVGAGLLVVGLARSSRPAISRGVAVVFLATLAAGIEGAPPGVLLVGVTATVLAWDAGTTAVSVGEQLGRDADTVRIEAFHVGASAAVGAVVVATGYLLFSSVAGGAPVSALVLLVVAAVLLVAAVQYETDPVSR